MLFCRLLPTVFLLLSASVLTPSASAAVLKGAEASQSPSSTHPARTQNEAAKTAGHVDSGAFLTAVVATHQGDDLDAARAFRVAAAADPTSPDLLKQAFIRSVLAGDPEAVPLARLTAKLPEGQSIISSLVLGNDAVTRGDWTEASRDYQQAGVDPMAHLIMPLLQAWCQQAQGHADEAIASLTHIQGSVLVPFYTLHAALIAQTAGQTARAGDLFAQAARLMPGYDLLLTRSQAAWFWSAGQQDKARQLIRNMIQADPMLALAGAQLQATISHAPVTSAQGGIARAYVLTAFLLRQQGHQQGRSGAPGPSDHQFDEASRLMLGFALELDPHLAEARLMLAEIQDAEGHQTAARETLLRIPQTDPLYPVAAFRLALVDGATDHLDEAQVILTRLAQDTGQQAPVVRALGNTLSARKDWKGAIAAYDQAVTQARANKTLDWSLLFLRAVAYHEVGDWPRTKADLQEALRLAPDEPLLLNFLGYSMVERKENLNEAAALLRRAADLDPQDAAIRDSLGWVQVELGDLAGGTALLERAAEQTPEDPEVNYHLGEAYWRAGRRNEAVDQWNVALGLHPEPADEALIRAALARAATAGMTKATQPQRAAQTESGPAQSGGKRDTVTSATMDPTTRILTEAAPAKINLYLHVTGRRPDGYHLLDSLVVFAGAGDRLRYEPGPERLHLVLAGRFGAALCDAAGPDNLVMKAAAALEAVCGPEAQVRGGRLVLEKDLPVASGIGGGSADAAAALRLLNRAWNAQVDHATLLRLAEKLGADVPVCLASQSARMEGIGEVLSAAPVLPECGMVLVNCGQAVSTPDVFRKRDGAFLPRAALPDRWPDAAAMVADLTRLDNSLEAPACVVCPPVRTVLSAIGTLPDCLLSRMSGSGATCFGLFPSAQSAQAAAAHLAQVEAGWWVWGGGLV